MHVYCIQLLFMIYSLYAELWCKYAKYAFYAVFSYYLSCKKNPAIHDLYMLYMHFICERHITRILHKPAIYYVCIYAEYAFMLHFAYLCHRSHQTTIYEAYMLYILNMPYNSYITRITHKLLFTMLNLCFMPYLWSWQS